LFAGETHAAQRPLAYPPSMTLEYIGEFARQGHKRTGTGRLQWKLDGAAYELHLQAHFLGLEILSQHSAGHVSTQGLEPVRFADRRGTRSQQAAHFRREKSLVEFSNNKPSAALQAGAQDRLSVLVQLAGWLMADVDQRLIGKHIALQVASTDDAQVWEFLVEGMESVSLPEGQIHALRLQRRPRYAFDQRLEIWLAADLGFLPVRIKQSAESSPEANYTDLRLSKPP
jgi:Protein of unknown function (DUF3108)